MNALRNIFTSRTLNYLRQNGQNAILNATQQQQAVDAVPLTADPEQPLKANRPAPLSIPRSILDACQFTAKTFDLGRTASGNQTSGSLSPTTLKRFGRMQRRMELVYRCKLCNTRNTKTISEEAYYSGVVILQCDGCAVDHLIKDNLGLFTGRDGDSSISSGISTSKNIDQVLAERHARVRVIKVNEHGELI
ncbi:DNL-type zinc finger protein [Drosophila biarmipes]|uniref:DNL-type zinc finger protein n=1 Tax=Drosophila biarmipes TaxID=125945 RepID=UPI0007E624B1|nr:DNL-type zinc finger protein [Drosophila biarmipes]